ncbi:unnamed protein product [Pleuronectes platessa]|uniref:Gelsolin-like domain-containing protein n=1 Tax=Pleuronectes platessa TaxID=8262 RepID=A0A9N7Y608_PLEPL|nr:unnamed protein product [Pleuronectes platessa]
MSAVQLLRVSVHERISAAAEDFLLQVEKRGGKAQVPALRAMLTERLMAAGKEILAGLEETVAQYEDLVERSEREICRQRRLLDTVMQPVVQLHRAVCPADIQQLMVNKEEVPPEQQQWSPLVDQEEPWTNQDGQQLQGLEEADILFELPPVAVKREEDEEKPKSSKLHPSETKENRADCGGPEPARKSGPDGRLQPGPDDKTEDTFRTGTSTRLDDRVFAMCQLKYQPLVYAMLMIHPSLYRIDDLNDEVIYLWIGRNCHPNFLSQVLGVPSYAAVPENLYTLPELDTAESQRTRAFIGWLRDQRPFFPSVHVIRDESPLKASFMQNMTEDRTESALSYYEFLLHIQQQISK